MRHADQEWAGLTVACKNGTCAGSWGPLGSGAAAVGLALPCPAPLFSLQLAPVWAVLPDGRERAVLGLRASCL